MDNEKLKRCILLKKEIENLEGVLECLLFIKNQSYHENYSFFKFGYDKKTLSFERDDFENFKITMKIFYNQLEVDILKRLKKLKAEYANI